MQSSCWKIMVFSIFPVVIAEWILHSSFLPTSAHIMTQPWCFRLSINPSQYWNAYVSLSTCSGLMSWIPEHRRRRNANASPVGRRPTPVRECGEKETPADRLPFHSILFLLVTSSPAQGSLSSCTKNGISQYLLRPFCMSSGFYTSFNLS